MVSDDGLLRLVSVLIPGCVLPWWVGIDHHVFLRFVGESDAFPLPLLMSLDKFPEFSNREVFLLRTFQKLGNLRVVSLIR